MRDPGTGVELTGFDQADDSREIPWQGVARAEQRSLRPMEGGMLEADVFAREAYKDESAAVRDQTKGGGHRLRTAGSVDHDIGQITTADLAQLRFNLVGGAQNMLDVHLCAAEL